MPMHWLGLGSSRGSGSVKALVWFWIIDETYALTFVMSCEMSQVGAIPSEEHGGTQEMVMIT